MHQRPAPGRGTLLPNVYDKFKLQSSVLTEIGLVLDQEQDHRSMSRAPSTNEVINAATLSMPSAAART